MVILKTGRHKNKITSKRSVRLRTRNKSSSLYGGSGSDLHEREPCTWRKMIKYYYFLKLQNENASDYHICELINENKICLATRKLCSSSIVR